MQLSAVIITKNEEERIKRCLDSVRFADETVVVDAESTDRTAAIAAEEGARVFVRPWPGYGQQKNFGRAQAHGEWILFVDADEEVSEALASEIQQTIRSADKDFYWLRIVTVFLGKPLRHLFGHNPRLMRRTSGRWTETLVHEQVETNMGVQLELGGDNSSVLGHPLLHHSHPTIRSYLSKMHRYTTLDARGMAESGRHRSGRVVQPSLVLPPWLALRQFLKLLLYRRGIFDGPAGWLWCVFSAYYEFEMAVKYMRVIRERASL